MVNLTRETYPMQCSERP